MPEVVESIRAVRAAVGQARVAGHTIGLVPTMGALHDGHARLIAACRGECDFVAVSIFVNPTQFGPHEDYGKYPRTLEDDLARSGAAGAALVFAPGVGEMYPAGASSTYVEVPGLSDRLEGASRPGHFRGVATVVLKLFEIVRPDIAYFGEKDYQQLTVIRRMAADLNLPVAIRGLPIVREPDGLAMSSRNRYLDPDQRRAATVLHRALEAASAAVGGGERRADRVRQILGDTINSENVAEIDYVEVADAATLEPLDMISGSRQAVALLAVRIGPARLIDNRLLQG
jgi:pantoate--beta-alanine ligase